MSEFLSVETAKSNPGSNEMMETLSTMMGVAKSVFMSQGIFVQEVQLQLQ